MSVLGWRWSTGRWGRWGGSTCNPDFLHPKIQQQKKSERKRTKFKKGQWFFFYCEINLLVLSFMPSYPIFKQQLPTCSNNIIIIIINHFVYCLAAMQYCDQGICQLGAKLFAEEFFLLLRHWLITNQKTQCFKWSISVFFLFFSLLCGSVIKVYASWVRSFSLRNPFCY